MDSEMKEVLTETLNALERLMNLFRLERVIHLIVGSIALLMLLYAIVLLLQKELSTSLLASLFGSSGLIAVSSARITYFFNKAFKLVEDIIQSFVK